MSARIEIDREVKGLRSQLSAKRGDLAAARANMASAQRVVAIMERDIQSMEARVKELEAPPPSGPIVVTEHAVIRYLERAMGIDIDALRLDMVKGAEHAIAFMGDGELKRPEGHSLVVKNRCVVTVK